MAVQKKIMIVDDHPDLRFILRIRFEAQDFDVHEAEDGEVALDLALRVVPDVMLVDYMMPKRNGVELCRALREHTTLDNTKVILLTAKDDPTDKAWAKEAGADVYLTKPVDPARLVALVNDTLLS